ncbi:MAG: peptide deformylase [Deltaproteobacteria bacterium]|nr:peptide deformylase [Deltaproteobacteria bacterium]
MGILPVVLYPDPVLKTVCEPVGRVTPEIAKLLDDMAETMYAAPGIGLAAPQVGVKKRDMVCDVSWREEAQGQKPQRKLYQLVNPEIVRRAGEI